MGKTVSENPEEEVAQKLLKSMLNKITPQNFEKITAQIIDKINERKKAVTLQGFIDQIFDKALTETNFAELYADLVHKLNPALPELEDEEGNPVQFRRTLLNKCQDEFEHGATAMKAVAEREKRKQIGDIKVGKYLLLISPVLFILLHTAYICFIQFCRMRSSRSIPKSRRASLRTSSASNVMLRPKPNAGTKKLPMQKSRLANECWEI